MLEKEKQLISKKKCRPSKIKGFLLDAYIFSGSLGTKQEQEGEKKREVRERERRWDGGGILSQEKIEGSRQGKVGRGLNCQLQRKMLVQNFLCGGWGRDKWNVRRN